MHQVRPKGIQDYVHLVGKGYLRGTVQEIKFWRYYQMLHVQTWLSPLEWEAQNSLRFWDKNHLPNP